MMKIDEKQANYVPFPYNVKGQQFQWFVDERYQAKVERCEDCDEKECKKCNFR